MMLDSRRNLKLVDFGLAQTFDHDGIAEADHPLFCQLRKVGGDVFPLLWATDHNPHQTNLANGTEGYAPPEVWKCQMHSFGIDYFAMGCALHMLITGNVSISSLPSLLVLMYSGRYRHLLHLTKPHRIISMTTFALIGIWTSMHTIFYSKFSHHDPCID
jgi:serine/threonine protein kinase